MLFWETPIGSSVKLTISPNDFVRDVQRGHAQCTGSLESRELPA